MNGAVKHGRIVSQILGDKVHVRSLQANLTICDQFFARRDASGGKEFFQLVRREKDRLVLGVNQRFLPVNVRCPGDVSIVIALVRARIHQHDGLGRRGGNLLHVFQHGADLGMNVRSETAGGGGGVLFR